MKSLEEFWKNYNIEIQQVIEHKIANTSTDIVYIKKAHYTLKTIEDQYIHKYRGIENNQEIELEDGENIESQLENIKIYQKISQDIIEKNNEVNIKTLTSTRIREKRLSDFIKEKDKNEIEFSNKIVEQRSFKLTNDDLPYKDSKEWKNRQKSPINYHELIVEMQAKIVYKKRIDDQIKAINKNDNIRLRSCPDLPKSSKKRESGQ